MNALMNETQLWYCDICDETIKIRNKSKHLSSKSPQNEEQYGNFLKGVELIKADIDEVNYILNDTIKDWGKNYFHFFKYRCVYDKKLTNNTNNEEGMLSNTIGYLKIISHFDGLKTQKC